MASLGEVAILCGRDASTVAAWLTSHLGVKVMACERSTAYAEGARQSVLEATQVADRLHLRQNLADTLDQVFTTQDQAPRQRCLRRTLPVVAEGT